MKHNNKHSKVPGLILAIGARPPGEAGGAHRKSGAASATPGLDLDTVPLDALQMPDDQDRMQPPEVGDQVNYQVTGKVVAIQGNQAQVQRTSINGQDVSADDGENEAGGDGEGEGEGNDGGADGNGNANANGNTEATEGKALRDAAGGMGLMMVFHLFFLLAGAVAAGAQSVSVQGNASLTNYLVSEPYPAKLYAVMGYNASGATVFIQVFRTNGVPANGSVPVFSVPVAGNQYYSIDFSYYGADLDAIAVASSSTPASLTLTGATTSFQTITKSR